MKIHSDTLTPHDLGNALRRAQMNERIAAHVCYTQQDRAGSRKRAAGYLIRLGTYEGGKGTSHPMRPMHYSGDDTYAAQYDEWGWLLAELFEVDHSAVIGKYDGRADFHRQTSHRFLIPARSIA